MELQALPTLYQLPTVGGVPDDLRQGREIVAAPVLWPDPDSGPWLVFLRLQVIRGRLECVGINLTSARPEGEWCDLSERMPDTARPITTAVLRSLHLSDLIAEKREQLAAVVREVDGDAGRVGQVFGTAPRRVMRESTRKRLERVAEVYREAWQAGSPPVKTVAERLGITEASASSYVARARAAGLLPATSPGVPVADRQPRGDDHGET